MNSESTSQVIVALCSLGINPDTDKRFIKNGKSPVDILLSYYVGNGFSHTKGSSYNQMATEQCFYGLVAYYRLCNNKNFLYNMTDVYEKPYDPTVTEATTTKPTVTNSSTHKNTTTNPTNTTNKTEVVYTTGSYNSTTENKTTPTYNHKNNNYQPNNYSNSVNSGVNSDADNSDDSSNSSVSNDNEETLTETTSNTESTTVSNTTTSTTESTTVTNNSTKENKTTNVITKSKDYKDVFINLIMIFVVGILAVVLGTLIMMIKKKSDK